MSSRCQRCPFYEYLGAKMAATHFRALDVFLKILLLSSLFNVCFDIKDRRLMNWQIGSKISELLLQNHQIVTKFTQGERIRRPNIIGTLKCI